MRAYIFEALNAHFYARSCGGEGDEFDSWSAKELLTMQISLTCLKFYLSASHTINKFKMVIAEKSFS